MRAPAPRLAALTALACLAASFVPAQDAPPDGLAAWDRIYRVVSHPRCANCHVGAAGVPMWSGPSYGAGAPRPHGMNVSGGDSRMGAETLLCSTCHAERDALNDAAHAAPQVAAPWRLPPPEMQWFGLASARICAQLRDPARNGGRSLADLAEHATHDAFVGWGWTPGGGRDPAPGSQAEHVADILAWGTAGFPCPEE